MDILEKALQINWQQKFISKSPIFYYFIVEWVKYINETLVINKMNWGNIPGYNRLLMLFVDELKHRSINSYKKLFQDTGNAFVQIPNNLQMFINTLVQRTNLEDSSQLSNIL